MVIDERLDNEFGIDMDPSHGAVALAPPLGPRSDPAKRAVGAAGVSLIGLLVLVRVLRRVRRSRPAA
jgi:hypothetical protein